jgi:hypothetical protein
MLPQSIGSPDTCYKDDAVRLDVDGHEKIVFVGRELLSSFRCIADGEFVTREGTVRLDQLRASPDVCALVASHVLNC